MTRLVEVVSGLILHPSSDNRMLLGRRGADKLRPSMWEHPGGKVEPDEQHEAALRRELHEELGLDVRVHQALATCLIDVEVVLRCTLYRCSYQGTPKQLDHDELRWVHPDEAIKHLPLTPASYHYHRAIALYMGID